MASKRQNKNAKKNFDKVTLSEEKQKRKELNTFLTIIWQIYVNVFVFAVLLNKKKKERKIITSNKRISNRVNNLLKFSCVPYSMVNVNRLLLGL